MSNRMSVALALRLTGGEVRNVHAGLIMPAARTVVAQAEQIERLQEAVEHALYYSTEFTSDLIQQGIILPSDMEPPA